MSVFMRKLRFGEPDRHGYVEVEIHGTVDRLMEIFRSQVKGPNVTVTTRALPPGPIEGTFEDD